MSEKTVTVYKPDGKTYTFNRVKSAYKNHNGLVYIEPNDVDVPSWGELVTTDLPVLMSERD